ncbi:MAG: bifunctional folylpolyglutamate synthase/dihydrofolate synthase [Clostridia bacterium]|nr:bifunctional folylpolyglutamate synthase/dihydrofolate synthase [Clostridia bacterium]
MTYTEALEYIMSRRKFQKSSSHERIRRLLSLLGDPQKKLRFVHVVGTNGKGSVSTALSCILSESGLKTGLFTSPYIIKFNERIKVDGEYIPDGDVAEITSLIKEKTDLMESEELYPTVFEVTTALAMAYFERVGCDIVVLEAGIGGKNDSTNVIENKLLSVIMSISSDHTEMLGSTAAEIAFEKCGIIPMGGTVVSYPFEGESFGFLPQNKEAAEVIKRVCAEKKAQLITPDISALSVISEDIKGTDISYRGLSIKINLCGKHQIANMLTAVECVLALRKTGLCISDSDITEGIKHFFIPGRTELISEKPLVILDGGHNEGCMLALKETLCSYLSDRKITLLCAFMKDKDYEKSLSHILPLCSNAVFTCTDRLRGEDSSVLCRIAKKYINAAYAYESTEEALEKALSLCRGETLVVCGSFYLVSEVRKILLKLNKI